MSERTREESLQAQVEELSARVAELTLREQAALEQLARAQLLVEASPGLLYIFDVLERRNVYSNRQMAEVLGYSAEQIQAMGAELLPTVVHPEDWAKMSEHSARIAQSRHGEVVEHTYRVCTPKGEIRWLHDRDRVIKRTPDGAVWQVLGVVEDITDRKRAAEESERAAGQQMLIASQQAALRELGAPLIPIAEGVIAMPLIGVIDAARAQQILEALLDGITSSAAAVAILDITGVRYADAQVADGLIKAARAARLLGAEVVLTGVGPEIARTMIELELSLQEIVTRGTFQSGIAYALSRVRPRR
ncbi:MAG TPA: PAS domain-containing protein [Candidatus Nanopelagicales bacterium]|nr:PAS domain-containing protein [Candidatus Nanopelagicales bacterium]